MSVLIPVCVPQAFYMPWFHCQEIGLRHRILKVTHFSLIPDPYMHLREANRRQAVTSLEVSRTGVCVSHAIEEYDNRAEVRF